MRYTGAFGGVLVVCWEHSSAPLTQKAIGKVPMTMRWRREDPNAAEWWGAILGKSYSVLRGSCRRRALISRFRPSLDCLLSSAAPSPADHPSTEPIPLRRAKRLRRLEPAPRRNFLLLVRHRRRIPADRLPARIRPPTTALAACSVGSFRFPHHHLLNPHAFTRLTAPLFCFGALGAVGIDAALGEVVGAAAGEDEHGPAVAYRADLACLISHGWSRIVTRGEDSTVFIAGRWTDRMRRRNIVLRDGAMAFSGG